MLDPISGSSPRIAASHEGYAFDPTGRTWKISHRHTLIFKWVDQLLGADLANSFLRVLEHYAKKYSASHTKNLCYRFQHFAAKRSHSVGQSLLEISAEDLIGYRSTLDREHEWYLGALRGFFRSWADFGYSGLNEDVPRLLDSWRLRGNIKGRAVQTLCPNEGPLSDLEFAALHQRLVDEFESDGIHIEDFTLLKIFIATGRRPAQLSDLKVKDFIDVQSQSGLRDFLLNVPRRKQRGISWREQFRPFALSSDIGLLVSGNRLRVFPTRLRRTLATRAAREGFGELIIAELLDHTDTQNARVYTENVPEHVDAINEAVARQLAPLAQAFAGVVVAKESDAIRGDDLESRVRCERGSLGTCGHYGFCGALAPIACYTCRNFQPWVDGPHKEVLESLIAERDRILEITKDNVMASVNDRTILAVTQVIQICEQRRAASEEDTSHG